MYIACKTNASRMAANCGMRANATGQSRLDYYRTLILHGRFTTAIV